MKKIILILTLFLYSCGYQAINTIEKSNFIISEYKLSGDARVNQNLKRNFEKTQKKLNFQKEFNLIARSDVKRSKNSKDKAGEATNLSLKIIVNLEIFQENKKIKDLVYIETSNFNNISNKFELKQFEKILINNLTDQIIKRINQNLSSI